MRSRAALAFALVPAAALGLGLASGCATDGPECARGADCASGACSAQGRCVPQGTADATTPPPAPGADAGDPDATPTTDAPPLADAGCTPDRDGRVTREEVPLAAGLRATFRVAKDAAVASAGVAQPDGTRLWDLSADLPGDALALVETQKLDDKWYRADFPGATYAARLSERADLLGVFAVTPASVELRGVVSPADGLTKTRLAYAPAPPVLAFPLEVGKSFTTTATVTGLALGVFSTYSEKYDAKVDARGTMKTPLGAFPVLRVRTVLTRTVGLVVTTIRSFAWVAECYGTVASYTSADNDPNAEPTRAAEVRRIAP